MQLAPSTLPLGRRGVNSVEMAKHVEPIAESWRTGVQIPPAPPNKPLIFRVKIRGFSLGVEKVSISHLPRALAHPQQHANANSGQACPIQPSARLTL